MLRYPFSFFLVILFSLFPCLRLCLSSPFLPPASFLPDPEQPSSASPGHHPDWHNLCRFSRPGPALLWPCQIFRHCSHFPVPADGVCHPSTHLLPTSVAGGRGLGTGAWASLEGSQVFGELHDVPPGPDVQCPHRELPLLLSHFTVMPRHPVLLGMDLDTKGPHGHCFFEQMKW